jgi:hypothetical protein
VDVFAIRELHRTTGKPRDDKPIFDAFTSLMKAQAYEMSALHDRKKGKRVVYQFNLLTVAETEFVRLHFDGADIIPSTTDREMHVPQYIINREQTSAQVHFVTATAFPACLKEFEALHQANAEIFPEMLTRFYADIERDPGRLAVLIDEFNKRVLDYVRWRLPPGSKPAKVGPIELWWDEKEQLLQLRADLTAEEAAHLNASEHLTQHTRRNLMKVYKYEGRFKYVPDLPF